MTLAPSYYEALKRLTLELAGVKLGTDHAFLVETRLATLAQREGFSDLNTMIKELFNTGQTRLAIRVVSSLVERDTHFYRDQKSFKLLKSHVLPHLHRIHKGGKIRILSFGCMSGQEAYGIAMTVDRMKDQLKGLQIDIVGVDYPSQALERAQAGRYTHFEVQRGLPIRDLIEYFDRDKEDWIIKPSIRKKVTFKEAHLLSNLNELEDFHVILFRGNLTHYTGSAQVRVLRGLSTRVKAFGYLILGTGETLEHINYGFNTVARAPGLYRKREDPPEEIIEDPTIKKPTDKKTFEQTKRRKRKMIGK
ncbi:MAG: CheR family methyltransferase [Litorimonas sp.]